MFDNCKTRWQPLYKEGANHLFIVNFLEKLEGLFRSNIITQMEEWVSMKYS